MSGSRGHHGNLPRRSPRVSLISGEMLTPLGPGTTPLVSPLVSSGTYSKQDTDPLAVFHTIVKGSKLDGFSQKRKREEIRRSSSNTNSYGGCDIGKRGCDIGKMGCDIGKRGSLNHHVSQYEDTDSYTWYQFVEGVTSNGCHHEDTCKTSISDTLVGENELSLLDDKSFPNDDTLDDDEDDSLFSLDDWDDGEDDVIFCEESVAEFLPVEDLVSDLYHGDGSVGPCHHGDRPASDSRVWKFIGLVFVLLLARIGYNAWILVQLHASVHNWTTEDVELWLKDVVGLPQYLPIFRKFKIDGNFLPRLALNTDHLIQGQLGISDHNHKNKLILKAMDLVLFGPPKVFYNPIKDALLALAILVAISGLFFSTVQRRKAQNQISKMIEEVDKLQDNEQKFIDIQNVLHEAERKNETVVKEKQSLERKLKIEINQAKNEAERLSKERELTKTEVERLRLAEEELEQVRIALHNAETKQVQNSSISRELQTYLKTTYRKEREQYNIKKSAADKQLEEAKQWGFKMKKKRAGVVSSLKMIHGNSLEAVENRICSARTALIEATSDLQELSSRWRKIENLCNFNITASDDAEFGSSVSLAGSDSNSSPEPSTYGRSNSSPTKLFNGDRSNKGQSQSLKSREKPRPEFSKIHGSTPNLSIDLSTPAGSIPRISSSTAVKDLAQLKGKTNGLKDSTDSDDSSHTEKRRKGKNLWRVLRESRLNADQKWKDLLQQAEEI